MDQATQTDAVPDEAADRLSDRLLREKDARIAELTADKARLYRLLGEALANRPAVQASADAAPRERAGAGKASGASKGPSHRGSQDTEDWWARLKAWFFNA